MDDTIVHETNAILAENRNILQRNYLRGKTRINTIELIDRGFSFSYHTHELKHQDSEAIFEFCYDYGIGKLKDDWYEIIWLPL
jgi:hypothetical protein